MAETIDIIGERGGLIQLDGRLIAQIIALNTNCTDKTAERAAFAVIKYLVEAIAKANEARTQ